MKLIKNANLVSMADVNYELRDILVNEGKIVNIGTFDPKDYPNVEVIDALGMLVTPGIVDPHCHIGLYEEVIGWAGADGNEMTSPITPELRGIDAVKPHDEAFAAALSAGVTTVVTGPGSANVMGGTFCALKTKGKTVYDMVLKEEVALKMALGENPKRVYGNRNNSPQTRMGSAALMREWFFKAKNYYDKHKQYQEDLKNGKKDIKEPEYDMKLASLSRAFDGMIVKIHAHQADDIVTALRIKDEFGLNVTIEHATEGYLIADVLKEHNIPVIIGPVFGSKSKYELKNKSFSSGKILTEHGVEFAIMTDHPVILLEDTLTQAALFIKAGLSQFDCLKALTINAAKITGIADRVGSIEIGKDADIVIWPDDPFHYMTSPKMVMLNGNVEVLK